MSTKDQRQEWAQHIRDEDRAIALQQDSAGVGHTPVERPQPYTANELSASVAAAVAAERQRCAQIAERWSAEATVRGLLGDVSAPELLAATSTARAIAAEMRLTVDAPPKQP